MKAAVCEQFAKDYSEIKVKDVPLPVLRPGHAIVKIVSSSINPVDYKIVDSAKPFWTTPLPHTPGYDFSGTVHSVSDDVKNVKVGDEVFASQWAVSRHDEIDDPHPVVGGAFAEYILIRASKLSHKPAALSHDLAATIGIAATTAHEGIFKKGLVKSGQRILILGGTSAVGLIAIQIAKLQGAIVTATTSTKNKDFVRSLGVDRVVTYDTESWDTTDDAQLKNFDFVFDCVGEKDAVNRIIKNKVVKLKPDHGRYATIVSHEIGNNPEAYPPIEWAAAFIFSQDTLAQDQIAQWLVEKKLNIPIDSSFNLTNEGIVGIFNKVKSGRSVGKNILHISK